MKMPFVMQSIRLMGILATSAGLLVSTGSALAQTGDPLDANNSRTSDPFSNQDGGYGGFFDMMHRVQRGTIRSTSEYSQDQQESMGSEAQNFRMRQMEQLNQQNSQSPSLTTPAPAAVPDSTTAPTP
jgi:hypothetical protein